MKTRPRILAVLYFVLLQIFECYGAEKVLLSDVQSLTLHSNQKTTGRRSSGVPQLKCVGGSAKGLFTPKIVQCQNKGFDGHDYQWECTANMDDRYEFGRITVSCEGYDYPNDPYVLYGSCGLEYELEYSDRTGKTRMAQKEREQGYSPILIIFGFIALFIAYSIYSKWGENGEGGTGPDGRGPPPYPGWRPGGGGGGGGGPDGRPPGAPPPYDDHHKGTFTQQGMGGASSSSGPGFWSGAGLGAAAGYMASRAQNAWSNPSSSMRHRSTPSAPSSSGMHSSTGWFNPPDDWDERQREEARQQESDHGEHESTGPHFTEFS
ncbi:unnamed protein product, partial [Mesorhabditis spiculigera]